MIRWSLAGFIQFGRRIQSPGSRRGVNFAGVSKADLLSSTRQETPITQLDSTRRRTKM